MSSNPLKIKIKFSKGPASKTDHLGLDGAEQTCKKRKKSSEQKLNVPKASIGGVEDLNGRKSEAERDLFAEAKRAKTDTLIVERQKAGNEHSGPKAEQSAKPRLVIKYVTSKLSQFSGR